MSTRAEEALRNPVILREIFKYRPLPPKEIRLMSQAWNQTVLSFPKPLLGLVLDSGTRNLGKSELAKMEGKLARNIRDMGCDESTLGSLPVCMAFREFVQFLDITINHEHLVTSLYGILANYSPNLTRLTVNYSPISHNSESIPTIETTTFQKHTKLTELNLMCKSGSHLNVLFETIKTLILSAPNLLAVKIPANFYPDFSPCKKLRSLSVTTNVIFPTTMPDFSFDELTRMLQQVSGTLETLEFEDLVKIFDRMQVYEGNAAGSAFSGRVFQNIAKMGKLTHLRNDLINIFSCGDGLEDVSKMPFLKSLHISKSFQPPHFGNLDDLIGKIGKYVFGTVAELNLREIHDPELIGKLNISFPSLTFLSITSGRGRNSLGEISPLKIGPILEACSKLEGLAYLILEIPTYPEKLSEFVGALMKCGHFLESLTTFMLHHHNYERQMRDDLTVENGIPELEQLLKSLRKIGTIMLDDVVFSPETLKNVESFKSVLTCNRL
ncbi:hypothetical protein Fcan01_16867 [Folsomia candida]|uniref:Uncharacterized protein n=2 Tax=Folsomia candida TaxID=158441 RepID=A0A226DT35_FOLCA|nr:hypothetical protein Fcan01_16867 [Folsomia candida]